LETPLGDLEVDSKIVSELKMTTRFTEMKRGDDELEHSLEMHLPMIKHVFNEVKIVPIIVGQLTEETEREYGAILAPYFERPGTLFIISSDFCHWGDDFDYTPYENLRGPDAEEWTPIWEFV